MLPSVSNKTEPSLCVQQCKAPIHFTETEVIGNASGFVVSLKTSLERRPSTSHDPSLVLYSVMAFCQLRAVCHSHRL